MGDSGKYPREVRSVSCVLKIGVGTTGATVTSQRLYSLKGFDRKIGAKQSGTAIIRPCYAGAFFISHRYFAFAVIQYRKGAYKFFSCEYSQDTGGIFNMKKLISMIMAAMLIVMTCAAFSSCGDTASGKYVVGICQLQPHVALDAATQGFKDALIAELGEENIDFIEQNAQGDSNTCTTIIGDFVTKDVDLILANATASLQAAANGTATIPVLGTSITEYSVALDIDNFNGTVGGNISGTSDLAPLDQQAAMITDLYPEAKTVGLLYCSAEPNSAYQVKVVRELLEAKNITVKDFSFSDSNDVASVAAAAAAASDVIYIPTDNTAATCTEAINGAVLPTKTPIIAGEEGICSGCGVYTLSISYYDLGVTTGKMAAQILKGEADISEIPIAYAENFTKKYNKTNCTELGIDIAALEAAGYTAISE